MEKCTLNDPTNPIPEVPGGVLQFQVIPAFSGLQRSNEEDLNE
jgi:hypothetical protein